MGGYVLDQYPGEGLPAGSVYLSCGDSSATDLPDRCVDLVITDPPFFDNVHYSELADFFHVWQRIYFDGEEPSAEATTRRAGEVQDTDAGAFGQKLKQVFVECRRVLKDDGLMVFSYHHSRDDGWAAVAEAVWGAGFDVVQAQPVKSEMSVATPKSRARSPIDLDILLTCRKRKSGKARQGAEGGILKAAIRSAEKQTMRFNQAGRELSENDVRVIMHSQLLVELSRVGSRRRARSRLLELLLETSAPVIELWRSQRVAAEVGAEPEDDQLSLVL